MLTLTEATYQGAWKPAVFIMCSSGKLAVLVGEQSLAVSILEEDASLSLVSTAWT